MPKAKTKSLYGVHPSIAMIQKWIAELPGKTGKDIDQWMEFIHKKGPKEEKDRRTWLKQEHGFGTNTAWWLAERATEGNQGFREEDPEQYLEAASGYVEKMYSGAKVGLKPIYDELLTVCLAVGKDVKACPCQTIVPIYRNHVIAQIKPTTRTRIDFGLALKDTPAKGKLIDTGGFAKKDRITHRIALESVDDITAELKRWLKKAYEMDE